MLNRIEAGFVTLYGFGVLDSALAPDGDVAAEPEDTATLGRELHAQFLGMSALAGGEIRLPDEVREAVS